MTTTEPTVAERFSASLGLTHPAPQQPAEPPATAAQPVTAPWGPVTDPHEAIKVFEAQHGEALLDNAHPLHNLALRRRSELYAAAHGSERGDTIAGNGTGSMSEAIHDGFKEPSPAEMQQQLTNTAGSILERAGLDPESSQHLAGLAIGGGLSTFDVSEITDAIANNARQYASPAEVMGELGGDAERLIAAAQAEADRLKLPAELLDMELASGICLGEHPAVVRQLARRAGAR